MSERGDNTNSFVIQMGFIAHLWNKCTRDKTDISYLKKIPFNLVPKREFFSMSWRTKM